jgi:hypothetical protein
MTGGISILERLQAFEDDHAFLRQFVIAEEDRHLFTTVKWAGEYRWFRSPNIVCLEKARLLRAEIDAGGDRAQAC